MIGTIGLLATFSAIFLLGTPFFIPEIPQNLVAQQPPIIATVNLESGKYVNQVETAMFSKDSYLILKEDGNIVGMMVPTTDNRQSGKGSPRYGVTGTWLVEGDRIVISLQEVVGIRGIVVLKGKISSNNYLLLNEGSKWVKSNE